MGRKSKNASKVKEGEEQPGNQQQIPMPDAENNAEVDPTKLLNDLKIGVQNGDDKDEAEATSKMMKPVIVDCTLKIIEDLIAATTFKKKPAIKTINANKHHVICSRIKDKRKLIAKLKGQEIKFFTYSEPSEKLASFVLMNYNRYELAKLKSILEVLMKLKPTKVTFLKDDDEDPIYIVQFKRGTMNIDTLKTKYNIFDHQIISWEKFDEDKKQPSQCYNCQRWGHSSKNCGFPYRCVKCTNDHGPGKCSRTTREGEPACVNCLGKHSANNRECPDYIKFVAFKQGKCVPKARGRHPIKSAPPA